MTIEQPIVRPSEPTVHKITVDEFLALDEAGFFRDRRVELIEGEIFEMAALHRPHSRTLMVLSTAVDLAVEALKTSIEALSPISSKMNEHSLPEADIIVAERLETRMVEGPTVRLVVEVSDSSLGHDLGRKLRLYARTGVPEYWVADVNARRIIRFHAPVAEDYAERTEFAFGEAVPSATIDGLTVDTGRLA